MKEKIRNKVNKQIICIIITIMLCNFIMPNYTYAIDTNGGGILIIDISKFACFIVDTVIEFFQEMFVSEQKIKIAREEKPYEIRYSPGTIFAGQIPAFDINFINPNGSAKGYEKNIYGHGYEFDEAIVDEAVIGILWEFGYINIDADLEEQLKDIEEKINQGMQENIYIYTINKTEYMLSVRETAEYININFFLKAEEEEIAADRTFNIGLNITEGASAYSEDQINSYKSNFISELMDYFGETNEKIKEELKEQISDTIDGLGNPQTGICIETIRYKTVLDKDVKIFIEYNSYNGEEYRCVIYSKAETGEEYKSSAQILQTTVATWYNALRKVALVGLLSILVYIGIRIVLTSTSAKEKAKYKAMLKDWLVALCILFSLHYIMSITITVVEKINEIIGSSVVGENGEDVLISTIRTDIYEAGENNSLLDFMLTRFDSALGPVDDFFCGIFGGYRWSKFRDHRK